MGWHLGYVSGLAALRIKMKTIIQIILIALVVFSSCVTQKKCNQKFPQVARYDSIFIRDLDTIKIVLPGDSIKIETKVPCDDFELTTENGRLKQTIKVINGKLQQILNIKPDTVYRYTTNTITKTNIVKVPEKIKYVPKFVKIMAWLGGISILITVAYLALKIRSKLV